MGAPGYIDDGDCHRSGAGRGIGRVIPIDSAREGAKVEVVVASRTASAVDSVVAEIEALGSAKRPERSPGFIPLERSPTT